jgi:GNAT superfamily N-acetyltransferase
MFQIEPVTARSSLPLLEECRALFRAYGEFLRASGGPALFCFSGLEAEIKNLPLAYSEHGGEILLASNANQTAGCIAYRSMDSGCCEIKRLFVAPGFRGHSLGKLLVSTALERARQNGYRTACLDTEPLSMAVARQIYLDLGFGADAERNGRAKNSLVTYLIKSL